MASGGGSKTTSASTNPAWFDKAGQDTWNFANSLVFNQPKASSANALTPTAAAPSTGGGYNALDPFAYNPNTGMLNNGRTPTDEQRNPTPTHAPAAADAAGAMSMDNLRPLQMYDGQRIAGLNDNQNSAIAAAREGVGKMQPYMDNAMTFGTQAGGNYGKEYTSTDYNPMMVGTDSFDQSKADQYMNPFVKMALDPTRDEIERSATIERNRMNLGSSMRGAFGGDRTGVAEAEINRNVLDKTRQLYGEGYASAFDKAMSGYQTDAGRKLTADMSNQGADSSANQFNRTHALAGFDSNRNQFNTDQDRKLSVAQLMESLAKTKSGLITDNINRLSSTGALQQQQEQNVMNQKYGDFTEQRDYPQQQLEMLLSVLRGSGAQGSVQNTTTQKPSTAGQIAGLAQTAAGAFMMSDIRLKQDIDYLGRENGYPIYAFAYKSDPSIRYKGVMAQEILQRNPEAVTMIDGFYAVDYDQLGITFAEIAHG